MRGILALQGAQRDDGGLSCVGVAEGRGHGLELLDAMTAWGSYQLTH